MACKVSPSYNKKMAKNFALLRQAAENVAPRLLGCELVRELNGQKIVGRIVETEAYDQKDAASHSYRGRTPRVDVVFGPAGHAYVYFTYGMHYCMNIVTGPEGYGSAVLIRALEVIEGLDIVQAHRPKTTDDLQLTNGPAKLCQALLVDRELNGHNLRKPPLQLVIMPAIQASHIVQTTRIGITRDTQRPWRFFINVNPYVSRRA